MKELDKLVENYFTEKKAPELGMDMLLEMVEQSLEEMAVDSFRYKNIEAKVLNILQQVNVEAKIHPKSTGPTLHITNMGNPKLRSEAIEKLSQELSGSGIAVAKEFKKYKRNEDYNIGATFKTSDDTEFKVELRDGREHTAENFEFSQLKEKLASLADMVKEDNPPKITIVFENPLVDDLKANPKDPQPAFSELYYNIDPSKVRQIGKQGGKADFIIGDEEGNQLYISAKDGGDQPGDFGQYGGLAKSPMKDIKEVQNFVNVMRKILIDELGLKSYPRFINFQQDIKDPSIFMKGIFGGDWEPKKESGKDNVDVLIQGEINFKPLDPNDPDNRTFRISGNRVFSRRKANEIYNAAVSTKPPKEPNFTRYFPDGYDPVFSVRYAGARSNLAPKYTGDPDHLGPNIPGARTAIQASKGRLTNFVITGDSTPDNIQFEPIVLNSDQYKKAMNFLNSITPVTPSAQDIWNKMFNSIKQEKKPTRSPIFLKRKKEQQEETP